MAHVRVLRTMKLTSLSWPALGLLHFTRELRQLPEPRRCVCSAQTQCSTSTAAFLCPASPLLASLLSRSSATRSRNGLRNVHVRAAPAKLSRGSSRPPQRQKRPPLQPSQRPGRRKGPVEEEPQHLKKELQTPGVLKPSAALKVIPTQYSATRCSTASLLW